MCFAPVCGHVVGATKGAPTVWATKGLFPLVGFRCLRRCSGRVKLSEHPGEEQHAYAWGFRPSEHDGHGNVEYDWEWEWG